MHTVKSEFTYSTNDYFQVALTVLAFLLENSGLLKAGRQSMKFEPQTGSGVKFSDVHGVDEAKEVCCPYY